ncbi:MAG: alpha/beta hydrolase [Cardiobacteriaceae bacterium]|nr:alpha/beta hydrolase [Cardiobacteriaceae bacterium]
MAIALSFLTHQTQATMTNTITPRDISIDLPHIRLAGLRWGEGEHIVIALHGWLDNAASFAPIAPFLVDEHTSLIALELAGHGHSAHRPLGSGYHFTDHMRDVMLAINTLGIEKIDFVCHSLGAAIASMLAGTFYDRIARLVCIECYGTPYVSDHNDLPERMRERLLSLNYTDHRSNRYYADLDTLIKARINAGAMHPRSAAQLVRRNLIKEAQGYRFISDKRLTVWQPMLLSEEQVQEFIPRITAPVLMIEGSNGFTANWHYLPARYQLTQDIRVRKIDGGHHLHMDNPEEVAAAIQRFWQENPV